MWGILCIYLNNWYEWAEVAMSKNLSKSIVGVRMSRYFWYFSKLVEHFFALVPWWARVLRPELNTNHINEHSLLSHSTTFGGVSSPKALYVPKKITRRIYWTIQPCLWGQSWFILGTRWIFMRLETIWYSLIMRPPPMMTSCRTFLHKFRPNELKPTQT